MSNLATCNSTDQTSATYSRPRYSTQKVENAWEIKAVVPGVKKGDVEITFEDDELTIVARKNVSVPEGWNAVSVRNFNSDGYELRLGVNVDIDGEAIKAQLEDGILTVTLPLSEAARPRTIQVQ